MLIQALRHTVEGIQALGGILDHMASEVSQVLWILLLNHWKISPASIFLEFRLSELGEALLMIFLFFKLIFIVVQLLYNGVLFIVSAEQQSESAIQLHVSPFLDFLSI